MQVPGDVLFLVWSARSTEHVSVSLARHGNCVPAADPGNVTRGPSPFQVAAGRAKLLVAGSRTTVQQ